ncbi:MAG: class I SAM-dependent methyltransferase [Sedimentisphaerales bacterium]|nr:class I SAM-dependent methyltransferase [Sedimentisphaerales bacterium]
MDYHDVERTTGHRWLPYIESGIVEPLKKETSPEDLIIEVGANDGAFLDLLSQRGYTNLIAIEPSVPCAEIIGHKGYRCVCAPLDKSTAETIRSTYGPAKAILCRHTLEHVIEPDQFILAMKHCLAEDGLLFIEVPDATRITDDLQGYLLWDEHIYSFFERSLRHMLLRLGFDILSFTLGQYGPVRTLLYWSCLAEKSEKEIQFEIEFSQVERCRSFDNHWKSFALQLQTAAEQWTGPILCLGASHPQSNFLLFTKLGPYVSYLVDDDPQKVGRYVPIPNPVKVISTDELFKMKEIKTIVCTAFGCHNWIDQISRHLQRTNTCFVDPYADLKTKLYMMNQPALKQ